MELSVALVLERRRATNPYPPIRNRKRHCHPPTVVSVYQVYFYLENPNTYYMNTRLDFVPQSVMLETACCTCAALLSDIEPQYDEKTEKPVAQDRRLDCCGRVICGKCISVRSV